MFVLIKVFMISFAGGEHARTAGMYALVGASAFLTGQCVISTALVSQMGGCRNVTHHNITDGHPH